MSSNGASFIPPKYRADIDGLRAIAVLSVVGYHAFPKMLAGGFIGVDIFFVISGFLISSITFSNLEHSKFSIIGFYNRRIRRIFPSLLTVMLCSFAFGWAVLLKDEYRQIGKHIAGGAGFISNLILWRESGYFDNAAEAKPMLHLWSLSIEEQFYIFWPLLLAFVWKRRWSFLRTTAAIAIISFALSLYLVRHNLTAAFYSPFSRFWELMVGGTLAYLTLHRPKLISWYKNGQSALGIVLLVTGLVLIDRSRDFPGWWALFPTFGTFFLISAGATARINKALLSTRMLVWFGLISYPLYLWHWPLLAYARILTAGQTTTTMILFIVVTSIFLAWATYSIIEKPIRSASHGKKSVPALIAIMFLLFAAGAFVYSKGGLGGREAVRINVTVASGFDGGDLGVMKNDCRADGLGESKHFAQCKRDSRQTERLALLGDSKAAALYAGLVRTSSDNNRWLVIGGNGPYGAPVPVVSDAEIYATYQALTRAAIETLLRNDHIDTVVLVMATRSLFRLKKVDSIDDLPDTKDYPYALEGLLNATDMFVKAGKKVVLLVDNPTLPDPKLCIGRKTSLSLINKVLFLGTDNPRCSIDLKTHLRLSLPYRNLLEEVRKSSPEKITIFDTLPYLCGADDQVCRAFDGDRLLYSYTDHVSDYAAGKIGKALNESLSK